MANIMQMFRAKNKVSRNSFDLSKKVAFTAQAGELLPIYSRICMPGDVFSIRNAWKTRTSPVNTAAFTLFKEYYDWYFVPLNLLWNKYNTWSTNMKENNQVATSINGTTQLTDEHPYFGSTQIADYLLRVGFEDMGSNAKRNQFGFARGNLTCKLLSYLGYGDFYPEDAASPSFMNFIKHYKASPWRLLAYQKIYQDWYRNSQWEMSRPETCNIDYIDGSAESLQIPLGDIDVNKVNMFDLQYANWNKDMFMGVLPNSQYGDAATIDGGSIAALASGTDNYYLSQLNINTPNTQFDFRGSQLRVSDDTTIVTPISDSYTTPVVAGTGDSTNVKLYFSSEQLQELRSALGLSGSSSGSGGSAFTILALRQAEALQKFKEIQQSNSQDFPSQTDAHFGHRPNNAYSSRCIRIGGYDGNIEIQDVDNTNITENEDGSMNGADIAGKGIARGSGNLSQFKADVPGVLMCIYHVKPLLDYASSGIAPDNLKTMFTDYAIPEFDKTGMVQVPLIMLTNKKNAWDSFDQGDGLLGYAPNYFDYKTDIDEVRGAFYNGGLQSWVAPVTQNYINAFLESTQDNLGSNFVYKGINYNFFKINPSVLNSIFATDASSHVDSDKFLVNCYFDIKAVRPLDVDGLPY